MKKHSPGKNSSCFNWTTLILKSISLGKYNPKFYEKGEDSYSTAIDGFLTIVLVILLISYLTYVMVDAVNMTHVNLNANY